MSYQRFIFIILLALSNVEAFVSLKSSVKKLETVLLDHLSKEEFDLEEFKKRLKVAYNDWCFSYGERADDNWMERFSFHYMVAEQYYKKTGIPVKLNEYAGLDEMEIQRLAKTQGEKIKDQRSLGALFLSLDTSRIEDEETTSTPAFEEENLSDDSAFWFAGEPSRDDKVAQMTNDFLEATAEDTTFSPMEKTITSSDKVIGNASVVATSLARDAAAIADLDLSTITGTGEFGIITLGDVEAALQQEQCESQPDQIIEPIVDSEDGDEDDTDLRCNVEEEERNINSFEAESATVLDGDENEKAEKDVLSLAETSAAFSHPPPITPKDLQMNEDEELPVVFATSKAILKARKHNIALSTIEGTGNFGRITLEDVKAAIAEKNKDQTKQNETDSHEKETKLERPQDMPSWVLDGTTSFEWKEASIVEQKHKESQGPREDQRSIPSWVLGGPTLAPASIASTIPIESIFEDEIMFDVDFENQTVEQQTNNVDESIVTEHKHDFNGILSSWIVEPKSKEHVSGTQIPLPELTMYMSQAKVIKWLKQIGEPVKAGEAILIVECDTKISLKTGEYVETQEIRAPEDGILIAKYMTTGDILPVGDALGVLGPVESATAQTDELEGATSDARDSYEEETTSERLHVPLPISKSKTKRHQRMVQRLSFPRASWVLTYQKFQRKSSSHQKENTDESRLRPIYATPMARVAARKADLDLSSISGSGEHGRITLDDVKIALYPLMSKRSVLPQQEAKDKASLNYSRPTIPFSTPMARTLAEKENIDLSKITGTGEKGRITVDDVKSALMQRQERNFEAGDA